MSYATDDLSISYKYDTNGLRTEKTVNGIKHEYYYVDGLLRSEQIGETYIVNYRYDSDGNLFSVSRYDIDSGDNYILYAQTNTRGDVISLYDGAGATRVVYTYDSWGKLVSVTNANGEPIAENSVGDLNSVRYRGYVYDSETGLYYLQSRYYDPETGRFLNADDVDFIGYSGEVLSYNAFAYCENNAVDRVDSSGNAFVEFVTVYTTYKSVVYALYGIYILATLYAIRKSGLLEILATDLYNYVRFVGSTSLSVLNDLKVAINEAVEKAKKRKKQRPLKNIIL